MEKIHDWNSACYPEIIDDCIHKLIEKQATECPNAPAIRAWDREFSYGELNAASNRLAHHLTAKHHLQVGQVVHVMFEKSAWYFVAILAINKAGGLWAPLLPLATAPNHRLPDQVEAGPDIAILRRIGCAIDRNRRRGDPAT